MSLMDMVSWEDLDQGRDSLVRKIVNHKQWVSKSGIKSILEILRINKDKVIYYYVDAPKTIFDSDFKSFLEDFEPCNVEMKKIPILKGSINIGRKDDSNKPKAVELLETSAATLIRCGKKYDSTGNNSERIMDRVTEAYTVITGEPMTPEQANIFMVCLKLVRSQTSSYHDDDHYIDGINYFAMAGESASESANK